jgi:hypothetical protein
MNLCQTKKRMSVWCRWVSLPMVLLLGCPCQFAVAGTPPALEFDVPFSITCRSLPCTDPAKKDPGKDLIEVVVPISVRVHAGSEKDLKHCLYTLVDPTEAETLSVRDWLPRTELKTDYAKPIQINNERLAKVGISLSAHYIVAAASDASGQIKSGVAYEMLPPQEIVLASGTVHQGHGVFFKLKPSTQTTLEGMKSFSAIFAVPHGWRGGCLRLQCEAVGLNRSFVPKLDREVDSGVAVFCLALHLAGDEGAEKLADQVATCQQELFDCLINGQREMTGNKALPWLCPAGACAWLFDRFSSNSDSVPERAEAAALNYALGGATTHTRSPEAFPRPVQEKLRALQEAMRALQSLATGGPPAGDQVGSTRRTQPDSPSQPAKPNPSAGSAVKPASSTATGVRVTVGFAELDDSDRVPPRLAQRKNSPVGDGRNKERAVAPTGPRAANADDCPQNGDGSGAGSLLSPSVDSGVRPRSSASSGNEGKTPLVTPPEEASKGGQLSGGFPKQAWYLIASIGGAVFTYIGAPLLVELIRKHMSRRQRRSKGKALPSISVQKSRRSRLRVPYVIPMLLTPRDLGLRGRSLPARPDDDQSLFASDQEKSEPKRAAGPDPATRV